MFQINADSRNFHWLALLALGVLLVTAGQGAAREAVVEPIIVEKSPSLMTFIGSSPKVAGRLKVRIAAPSGEIVFESVSRSGLLDWVVAPDLADGQYRWDAWFVREAGTVREGSGNPDVHYRSGRLRIQNGSIRSGEREISRAGVLESVLGRLLGALVPAAHAAASHNDASVILDNDDDGRTYVALDSDTTEGAFNVRWQIWNLDERLEFNTFSGGNKMALTTDGFLGIGTNSPAVPLQISDTTPRLRFMDMDGFNTSGPTAWTISASSDEFRLQDNDGGGRPLVVDAGGDSGGAPTNSLYIASNDGDIGLGTSTPTEPLHIVDASPQIRYERSGSNSWFSGALGASADLFFIGSNQLAPQFLVNRSAPGGTLQIGDGGNIGMGTSPNAALHLERADGSARLLVEEGAGSASARELFKLSNNGGPFFIFENRNLGESYAFAMGATGHFLISHQQSSGVQFRLKPNGDADFQGDVTANGMLLTSAREAKTDISPVDSATILEKVASMDISEWRYRRDATTKLHIGPMAGDFRAIFGLGDGKHISAVDLTGVSLAAIKGLAAENRAKERLIERLESRIERLERLVRTKP